MKGKIILQMKDRKPYTKLRKELFRADIPAKGEIDSVVRMSNGVIESGGEHYEFVDVRIFFKNK